MYTGLNFLPQGMNLTAKMQMSRCYAHHNQNQPKVMLFDQAFSANYLVEHMTDLSFKLCQISNYFSCNYFGFTSKLIFIYQK